MCRLPFGQLISIGRGSSFISSPRCSERDSFSSRFPPDQWTTDRDKHSLRTLCSLVRPFISICPRPKSKEGFIFLSFFLSPPRSSSSSSSLPFGLYLWISIHQERPRILIAVTYTHTHRIDSSRQFT